MKRYPQGHHQHQPSTAFIYLLVMMLVCAIVFGLLGIALGYLLYGSASIHFGQDFQAIDDLQLNFLSVSQICSAIGTFVIPAILLNRWEKENSYFSWEIPKKQHLIWLAVLFMFVSVPFFEWLMHWNQQMKLPETFHEVERWMKEKEEQTAMFTEALLSRKTIGGFLTNLFMVGVLAAVGEELFFRGCLQNIFSRWMKNPHAGIWLAAIVFSAIHLQFYGFLPRMLIGAVCGYLYFWSGNIWLPITVHFINNGGAILVSYLLVKQGKPIDYLDGQLYSWPVYVLSMVVSLALLAYFRKEAKK